MIEKKDLILLKEMFEEILDEKLTKAFAEQEARLEARMDEKLAALEARLEARMDEKLAALEARMDEKLNRTANMILGELGRTHDILEEKIMEISTRLSETEEYYRIRHLEDENVSMILQMHDELEKRVARLEERVS